ncbi:MAG: SAM-dependent methyltransferase [Anaerolineae bacterium]
MQFLELKDISERFMEILNPSTPEKVLKVGEMAGMQPGQRIIDFGTGFAEPLVLWAERFGISGVGIDVRPDACRRANAKVAARGLAERIHIVCGSGSAYEFAAGSYDVASCVGATFIWGGYAPAIAAMRRAIKPSGRLVIGEPHWLSDSVPGEIRDRYEGTSSQAELLRLTLEAGFEMEYVVAGDHDDWDRYEADDWRGLLHWIETNPEHPDRQQVIDHLHESQDDYLRYGRMYLGWAMYVLRPASAR